jgi:hypothetical protein
MKAFTSAESVWTRSSLRFGTRQPRKGNLDPAEIGLARIERAGRALRPAAAEQE